MRQALPAAGTFVLTLGLLDPVRLPQLAAGLGAAAGAAAVVLLLTVIASRAACRRHGRAALPPAAGPASPAASLPAAGWHSQPPTQPMNFRHQPAQYAGPDFPGWDAIEAEHPPDGWDDLHRNVAREWNGIMRRPDEQPGTADMTEFEEKWKTS